MKWVHELKKWAAGKARRPARLNLDYAAATPPLSEVVQLMHRLSSTITGNPSALHQEGVMARKVIDAARLSVARTLEVREEEVLFTASGTESNNLAISGYLESLIKSGRAPQSCVVLTTATEHPSIGKVLEYWQRRGVRVVTVPVDGFGFISEAALREALNPEVVLLTFAYGNSEIGVVQPVRRLARIVREYERTHGVRIVIHLDACQAPLWLSCQPRQLGVDLMSLDAGKCNGPKGVGFLIVRPGVTLEPIIHGGGQERGLRGGTENTPAIAGAALALLRAQEGMAERSAAAAKAAAVLRAGLVEIPGVVFNGPSYDEHKTVRLPHNVNISIPGLDTEFAAVVLDAHDIAVSTKSACSGAGGGVSATVMAISDDAARAQSTLRFTIDPLLRPEDMQRVVEALRDHVMQMQKVDQKTI